MRLDLGEWGLCNLAIGQLHQHNGPREGLIKAQAQVCNDDSHCIFDRTYPYDECNRRALGSGSG